MMPFLVPDMTQYDVQRPYRLVPSPYTVLHPSYGAIVAPYLAYVPPVHYSLPALPHQPVMIPIGLRQSSIQGWQLSANIPPWQNRANIPPRHRHVNISPRQRRANIPRRHSQAYISVMQRRYAGQPTELAYFLGMQPQPSYEAEDMIVYPPPQMPETDDVTQGVGRPAAQHVLGALPSVVLPLDDDVAADCKICMDDMCMQDEKDITKLPCDHLFHRNCIMLWLNNNITWPLCRFKLPTDETT